jgi:hypothetical protein
MFSVKDYIIISPLMMSKTKSETQNISKNIVSYTFIAVPENSAVGTLINTITATDSDLVVTSDAQITYGIDTVTTLFGIVPSTGLDNSISVYIDDSYFYSLS